MRSLLFVPADSEKKLAKALGVGADALIIDLEDSIAIERKAIAREMAKAFLGAAKAAATASSPRLYVRINPLATDFWEDDLLTTAASAPDGIMLPKATSGDDVHRLSIALGHAEERYGASGNPTRIIALVTEVPASILQLHTYIQSSARLEALTWGAEDLSAELGASATRESDGTFTSPYRLARDLTLFTAAAAGVQSIDTVYVNFRDVEGLHRECASAARDGFTGKLAIHPDQVAVINDAFTPSVQQISQAEEIIGLFRRADGAGVVSLNGAMLDRPHLVRAERTLARAERYSRR